MKNFSIMPDLRTVLNRKTDTNYYVHLWTPSLEDSIAGAIRIGRTTDKGYVSKCKNKNIEKRQQRKMKENGVLENHPNWSIKMLQEDI